MALPARLLADGIWNALFAHNGGRPYAIGILQADLEMLHQMKIHA